ncbi:TnsA-like heteromeric transposase endonuclease subunit [Streptomyces sp. NPDC050147]|uniref:TnsA-like heteromeric transposase endonuclease subunit n=1 Tax=Streptomyces sp. NPDC050147 TaxID=3155513 RepID=UPI00343BF785
MSHHSGTYASATTGGHVVYESRLEPARLLLADFDPEVRGFSLSRAALRLGAMTGCSTMSRTFCCSHTRVARVVNVKPAQRLQDPKIAEALAWPGELVRGHGREYEIWSGADRVVLENVRFLAAYRRPGVVPENEVERAWQHVVDGEELGLVERRLAGDRPRETARPPLLALLWSGRLTIDLLRPLSGESVLRRNA